LEVVQFEEAFFAFVHDTLRNNIRGIAQLRKRVGYLVSALVITTATVRSSRIFPVLFVIFIGASIAVIVDEVTFFGAWLVGVAEISGRTEAGRGAIALSVYILVETELRQRDIVIDESITVVIDTIAFLDGCNWRSASSPADQWVAGF